MAMKDIYDIQVCKAYKKYEKDSDAYCKAPYAFRLFQTPPMEQVCKQDG